MSSPEKHLWLAVLAQAVKDVVLFKLGNDDDFTDMGEERLASALAFVVKYPSVAKKLRDIKSREEMEQWLEVLEKALNRE